MQEVVEIKNRVEKSQKKYHTKINIQIKVSLVRIRQITGGIRQFSGTTSCWLSGWGIGSIARSYRINVTGRWWIDSCSWCCGRRISSSRSTRIRRWKVAWLGVVGGKVRSGMIGWRRSLAESRIRRFRS